ncbi:unnamed protein product [Orchesella dallaii]|uniref:Uncharacterized protein n=1 Tax=Orchesella dallaii TaxID=48710 RepID=A0ABP1QVP9_9HEXA
MTTETLRSSTFSGLDLNFGHLFDNKIPVTRTVRDVSGAYIQHGDSGVKLEAPFGGSVEAVLPCSSVIHLTNRAALITPPFPCPISLSREVQITHILPAAWSTVSSAYLSIITQHEAPTYANLSSILNGNWSIEMPVANLTIPENLLKNLKAPKILHCTATSYFLISFIWNILITLCLLFLLYRQLSPTAIFVPTAASTVQYVAATEIHPEIDFGFMETVACVIMVLNFLFFVACHCCQRNSSPSPENAARKKCRKKSTAQPIHLCPTTTT